MVGTLPNKLVEVCTCNFDFALKFLSDEIKADFSFSTWYQSSQVEKFMNSRQNMWSVASPSQDVKKMIENLNESCDSAMEVDES